MTAKSEGEPPNSFIVLIIRLNLLFGSFALPTYRYLYLLPSLFFIFCSSFKLSQETSLMGLKITEDSNWHQFFNCHFTSSQMQVIISASRSLIFNSTGLKFFSQGTSMNVYLDKSYSEAVNLRHYK